jgi:hypothetical protein
MPIVETNPKRAFERFERHMEEMVRSVLPLPAGVKLTLVTVENSGVLEFTRGGVGTSVPLETNLGELHLSLNQDVVAIREGLRERLVYRVRTQRYQYKLLPTGDPEAEAIIRWEFRADTPDDKECRNHLHINASLPVGHGTLTLARAHIPSAWVLVEHVLRFLFHDLQVPPRTDKWPEILRASETAFYEQFTSKRYRWRQ